MPTAPVLGPVAFSGFEVPERIEIGGRQRLVVHALPGGRRVVDAMGPDDAPIRWSGIFSGQGSAERVRMLERLRRSGSQMLFAWGEWRYLVVVQEFQAEVHNAAWIPYRIELCVVPQDGLLALDWLEAAVQPVLDVGLFTGDALAQGIVDAGKQLGASDLGDVVSAAGQLAQLVTERAYGGAGP